MLFHLNVSPFTSHDPLGRSRSLLVGYHAQLVQAGPLRRGEVLDSRTPQTYLDFHEMSRAEV